MSVSLFTFYTREPAFTRLFSLGLQALYEVLFVQVNSARITPIYLLFSYQDSFGNMITNRV